MSVAAIILAAGASTRLGEPKQLIMLAGERLLERALRAAKDAGCAPILVVLGANAARIQAECVLDGCLVLLNEQWQEGMASSIRAGAASLPAAADGLMVMTCDQPAVTADHLRLLAQAGAGGAAASSYAGRRGVPAFFPATWFKKLLNLEGDRGARDLLANAPAVELAGGEIDVDTVDALETARSVFG